MSTQPVTGRATLALAAARRMDRRRLLGLGGGVLGATLLAACGQGTAAGSDSGSGDLSIKTAATTPGTAGAVTDRIIEVRKLAQAQNLTVDRQGGGVGTGQQQLLAKLLDVFSFGPLGVAEANAGGHDVVIAGPALYNHGRWIVPAHSDATSIADLKGKRIGVQPSSSDTYKAAALAAAVNGINFDKEYQLFPGQPTASLALYDRGDLDAIIAIEPNATLLVADGNRQLATVGDLWQQGTGEKSRLFLNGSAFRKDWLADTDQKEAAKRFLTVMKEATEAVIDDPSLMSKYADAYGIKPTEKKAIALLPERLKDIYAVGWNKEVFDNIDKQIEVAAQIGLLKSKPANPVYQTLT
ncbi:hypothetical protein GCM10011575_37280 [Microlunatus endophyticus]|uniref:Sulfonate transport system substrate-binding protein n=1 Tax=Microlunatus endophyticus TaxID=1716077 RepID=A0A917SFN6_9ACTN|nr:ABC transporter substrate-binding protein [Microlunatus endophyticus]GGL75649.1 hypothetical protein GCM10011575_37280 [Microlunatus endophyticus]